MGGVKQMNFPPLSTACSIKPLKMLLFAILTPIARYAVNLWIPSWDHPQIIVVSPARRQPPHNQFLWLT